MEIFKSRIGDPMTTKPGKTVSKTFELDSKVMFMKVLVENPVSSKTVKNLTVTATLGG